jgi:hypothetical protein
MGVERIPLYVSDSPFPRDGEEFIRLAYDQFHLLDIVYRTDAKVRASFETLARHIFGGGMEVNKPGFEVTSDIQALFDGPWLRFCRDAMLHVFTYGFVLVRMRDGEVPMAINPLEFDITVVRRHDGHRFYRLISRVSPVGGTWPGVHSMALSRPVQDIIVFEKNAPDFMGRLTSIVPALLQTNSILNLMLSCAVKAQMRQAVPPLFLEHVPESLDQRELQRDIGVPGNNHHMHMAMIHGDAEADVQMVQDNEERVRRSNLLGLQNVDQPSDPITGDARYPVDDNGLPFVNIPVSLPRHRRLVQNAPSESPPFLVELMHLSEEDVARVTGVPVGLFGSSRSNIAADLTMMNIFYATQQDHRMMLSSVVNRLLHVAYGADNLMHMMRNYDDQLTVSENLKQHDFKVSFPGLLDPEILNMFQDRGCMHWDQWCTYTAKYYGIPREHLSEQQLDVMRDEPAADVQAEEQEREEKMMVLASELKMQADAAKNTAAGGGGGTKRKAPGPKVASAEKSKATRSANAHKLGRRTKRPGSAHSGVARGADVRS